MKEFCSHFCTDIWKECVLKKLNVSLIQQGEFNKYPIFNNESLVFLIYLRECEDMSHLFIFLVARQKGVVSFVARNCHGHFVALIRENVRQLLVVCSSKGK